ncbi:hypothetical protein C8F01DRAFT_1233991 [Mycena amicta]|nr:hypothetical protein C8F01DRAFT_1233991 [Mycena amicta]
MPESSVVGRDIAALLALRGSAVVKGGWAIRHELGEVRREDGTGSVFQSRVKKECGTGTHFTRLIARLRRSIWIRSTFHRRRSLLRGTLDVRVIETVDRDEGLEMSGRMDVRTKSDVVVVVSRVAFGSKSASTTPKTFTVASKSLQRIMAEYYDCCATPKILLFKLQPETLNILRGGDHVWDDKDVLRAVAYELTRFSTSSTLLQNQEHTTAICTHIPRSTRETVASKPTTTGLRQSCPDTLLRPLDKVVDGGWPCGFDVVCDETRVDSADKVEELGPRGERKHHAVGLAASVGGTTQWASAASGPLRRAAGGLRGSPPHSRSPIRSYFTKKTLIFDKKLEYRQSVGLGRQEWDSPSPTPTGLVYTRKMKGSSRRQRRPASRRRASLLDDERHRGPREHPLASPSSLGSSVLPHRLVMLLPKQAAELEQQQHGNDGEKNTSKNKTLTITHVSLLTSLSFFSARNSVHHSLYSGSQPSPRADASVIRHGKRTQEKRVARPSLDKRQWDSPRRTAEEHPFALPGGRNADLCRPASTTTHDKSRKATSPTASSFKLPPTTNRTLGTSSQAWSTVITFRWPTQCLVERSAMTRLGACLEGRVEEEEREKSVLLEEVAYDRGGIVRRKEGAGIVTKRPCAYKYDGVDRVEVDRDGQATGIYKINRADMTLQCPARSAKRLEADVQDVISLHSEIRPDVRLQSNAEQDIGLHSATQVKPGPQPARSPFLTQLHVTSLRAELGPMVKQAGNVVSQAMQVVQYCAAERRGERGAKLFAAKFAQSAITKSAITTRTYGVLDHQGDDESDTCNAGCSFLRPPPTTHSPTARLRPSQAAVAGAQLQRQPLALHSLKSTPQPAPLPSRPHLGFSAALNIQPQAMARQVVPSRHQGQREAVKQEQDSSPGNVSAETSSRKLDKMSQLMKTRNTSSIRCSQACPARIPGQLH